MPELPKRSVAEKLVEASACGADEKAGTWLRSALRETIGNFDVNRFLTAYAGVARRLRNAQFDPEPALVEELAECGAFGAGGWTASRAARTGLVAVALAQGSSEVRNSTAWKVFRTGDNEERIALLGALVLVPEPAEHLDLAVDACRTHVTEVFEAIACDNAYPARLFPDANFNQMILKAVFIDVPLGRVVGLRERLNEDLARMAEDYACERTAAGRPVPSDLQLLTAANDG